MPTIQPAKSEALNLALMYHRQRDASQTSVSENDIVKIAEKFHAFLIQRSNVDKETVV